MRRRRLQLWLSLALLLQSSADAFVVPLCRNQWNAAHSKTTLLHPICARDVSFLRRRTCATGAQRLKAKAFQAALGSDGGVQDNKVVAVELMQWLGRNAAQLDGVSLETGGVAGFGVIATEDLAVGHQALLVPRHAQLRADSEQLHPVSSEFAEQAAELFYSSNSAAVAAKFEEGALAAALLSELSLLQGVCCKWQRAEEYVMDTGTPSCYTPYLESLPFPREIPPPAWMWSEEELKTTPSAPPVADAVTLRAQIDDEFSLLEAAGAGLLASGERVTAKLWQYARMLVMTRCFDVGAALAMVPGIDAANHRQDALFEVFVDDEGELGGGAESAVLLVDRDVATGDEVFLSYGAKSNRDLLLYYGFSL